MMKDVSGLEIWEIKSTNDRCKYLVDGKCYFNYDINKHKYEHAPKWCRKEICKIKI